jgi:hypothetical protein
MRFSATVATLLSAPLVLLGAVDANADPSFVLATSQATAGDAVHFSISGLESDATYLLEIGDEDVASGSPAGNRVSGVFTMPNLGDTGRRVTVEAQIGQSGETTILTRTLEYLAPTRAATPGPTGTTAGEAPQPAPSIPSQPTVQPGPSVQGAPSLEPTPPSPARKRRGSQTAAGDRRAQRSPTLARERRSSAWQPSSRAGDRSDGRGSPVSTPPIEASAPNPAPQTGGQGKLTSAEVLENRAPPGPPGLGLGLATLLSEPLISPATASLTSGVADRDDGEATIAAGVVLALLGLAALILASARRRRWPSARPENLDADEGEVEILRGFVHVPSSGSASGRVS